MNQCLSGHATPCSTHPLERCSCATTLLLREQYLAATTKVRNSRGGTEKGGLPNKVELALGLKVMVTLNVETDLDVANGARGEITGIILHRDEPPLPDASVVELAKPPAAVLVKLNRTRMETLPGLEPGVIPHEGNNCRWFPHRRLQTIGLKDKR